MPPQSANRNDKSMCDRDRLLVMWTKEEDDILRDQVKLHGIDKWAKIATHLCGKTSRQCRRRWHMFLNVVNKRGGWSADEDKLLLEAHRKFGNRWTEIAKNLPGRTDNAVKNRFCVLCKKQTKEAGVSPMQRSVDSGSDDPKQKLQERRFLEGPKGIHGVDGANKKMRTAAGIRNKTPEVALQQRPLEETLQKWKGLHSSEVLTNSPHQHVSLEGSLQPWDSLQSDMLFQQNTQDERFQGWNQFALEGKGCATHTRIQDGSQQWGGCQSGAVANDTVCPKNSLQGESQILKVLQSHVVSMSSSNESRLMQDNLQHWGHANSGEASSELMNQRRVLKKIHSTWCGAKTTDAANNLLLQQRSVSETLHWWKGLDKNIMSDPALQQREADEVPHWNQNPQVFHNHQTSVDENLPPLNEMNSLVTMYMSSSKQNTSVSGMQGWSTMQSWKQSDHVQQSIAGGIQTWDYHLAKEDNSQLRSNENMHQWPNWNSREGSNHSPCQHSLLEHNMQIDEANLQNSPKTASFQEVSVKHLPMWATVNRQEATSSTVLHGPEEHQTHQWKHSMHETITNSSHDLLEDKLQQWDKSEAAVNPGPLILNCFTGNDSTAKANLLSEQAEKQGQHKSHDESWKNAVEKLKCAPPTRTADTQSQSPQSQSPREGLEFEENMSEGPKDIDLKTAAVFPPSSTPQASKNAEDSTWELQTGINDTEQGEMNAKEGLLPQKMGIEIRGGHNDQVESMKAEGQPSGVVESPPPDNPIDSAHSPTQIVPRSHLTMECMPSPQFTDSEKEFLLSTLDQTSTSTSCWSSSPLRPQSRFSKVRNPLIDIRYDTPARSPLSSCLLRQFQVTEASRLA